MGQATTIRKLCAALVTGGHVLLEDVPRHRQDHPSRRALARCLDATFKRVQFTPDLLPSDISGVSIYDARTGSFQFHRGPVFTHVLLADEINRASPRTQSALLEAMAEGQVSVDGERHSLPPFFFVLATQNPVEFHGTYPLPEAQLEPLRPAAAARLSRSGAGGRDALSTGRRRSLSMRSPRWPLSMTFSPRAPRSLVCASPRP